MFATEIVPPGELSETEKKQYLEAHFKGRDAFLRQQKYYSKGSVYRLLHDKPESQYEGIGNEAFD